MPHTRNRISESVHTATDSSREFVGQHPMSTSLAAFGLGLGIGVALTFLLSEDTRRESGVAHRLGHQMLDAMTKALPDSLMSYGR